MELSPVSSFEEEGFHQLIETIKDGQFFVLPDICRDAGKFREKSRS